MTDKLTFDIISDPGHGWFIVTPEQKDVLALVLDDFTQFSFVDPRAGTIYAEEDCDAAVVLAAHVRKFGCLPNIHEHHTDRDAKCRSMPRINGRAPRWREAMDYLDQQRIEAACEEV